MGSLGQILSWTVVELLAELQVRLQMERPQRRLALGLQTTPSFASEAGLYWQGEAMSLALDQKSYRQADSHSVLVLLLQRQPLAMLLAAPLSLPQPVPLQLLVPVF
jgi:hypothetical protein